MQRSFWSRAVSFLSNVQQPLRKSQAASTWGRNSVEVLETRTMLSAAQPFSDELSSVQDQSTSRSDRTASIELDDVSSAGKTITYEVGVNSNPEELVAQKIDELHGLYASESHIARNYRENLRGVGEKYLKVDNGWFYILPNGEVYRWRASIENSLHVATLDESYFENPEKLHEAHTEVTEADLLAAELDKELDFHDTPKLQITNFQYDLRGHQEKYLRSGNSWYFLTPDGALNKWRGSIANSDKVAQLDVSYYNDPSKLIDVQLPGAEVDSNSSHSAEVVDGTVEISTEESFTGSFQFTVLATDGFSVGQVTKNFSVINSAPSITEVGALEFSVYPDGVPHGALDALNAPGTTQAEVDRIHAAIEGEYFTIDLEVFDYDGDSISIESAIDMGEVAPVTQTYGLNARTSLRDQNYYFNRRGENEKYMQSTVGWVYILPNGEIYQWNGQRDLSSSTLLETVDSSYYDDPTALWTFDGPNDSEVVVSLDGTILTIDPDSNYEGTFNVVVSASDGIESSDITIPVTIKNGQSTFANFQFTDTNRWSETATDGAGLVQGDATTLTWTIVPDGTSIPSFNLGTAANSNLIEEADGVYGDDGTGAIEDRSWFTFFESVMEDWGASTGITLTYVSFDDGSEISADNGGVAGTRADIRISGRPIDGDSGVLAFNFFPDFGDMVIDTSDDTFQDVSNDSLILRNVLAHELGHGIGLEHVCPVDQTKLMEPFLSTNFDGPQFDDILAANRGYGDVFEKGNGNDTANTATELGFIDNANRIVNTVSIDGLSDRDYFSFNVSFAQTLTINLTPSGETYLSGPQNEDGTCSGGTDFNAGAQSNLEFMLIDSNGSTVLATADTAAIGEVETLTFDLPNSGEYFVRIVGAQDAAQMYSLEVSTNTGTEGGSISGFVYNDLNQNGTRDGALGNVPNITLLPVGDVVLTRNDDLSTDQLDFGFTLDLYGQQYDSFYINNNGNITFDGPLFDFVPDGFPASTAMIAPFWSDVDTTNSASAEVHLARGTSERGNPVVQIDWPGVGYFASNADLLNNFSLYIEDDAEGDIIVFTYGDMEWTTGEVEATGGFGGSGAQIGVDSGDGVNYFSLGRPNSPTTLENFTNTSFAFRAADVGFSGIEPGMAGVTVYIDENNNGVLDTGESSTLSQADDISTTDIDETGLYTFSGLAAGTYVVRQIVPDDFNQSEPANGEAQVIDLANGETVEQRNFGNFQGGQKRITLETETNYQISEAGSIEVTATLVGAPNTAATNIQLAFSGSATIDVDYTASTDLLTIAPGETSASLIISGIDDSLIELRESIIIDVSAIDSATELNGLQQATVFLTDNDAPPSAMTGILGSELRGSNNVEQYAPLHTLPTMAERKQAFIRDGRTIIYSIPESFTALIDVTEQETSGSSGSNDSQATGEAIANFGTEPLEDSEADISGNLGSASDVDFYTVELDAGDIIGVVGFDTITTVRLFDPNGTELMGSSQDAGFIYPNGSPLPTGGNAALAYVIPTSGTYSVSIAGLAGDYNAQFRVFRPDLEQQAAGAVQTLFIDFDGATIDASIFGGTGTATLSPLTNFLGNWGLVGTDEDAVINAILAELERSISTEIRANGNNGDFDTTGVNGDFDIQILNSRDHADPFGQDNVSRVIVGGTIAELGIATIGIAESIDIGNFVQEESAVVLLDLLSAAASDPNSLNAIPLGAGASIIDLIGTAVGNITAHEAGHFFGAWHTDQFNNTPSIMDQGGNLSNTIGLGADGIFGTSDDIDVSFTADIFVGNEGFTGIEDVLNAVAFGLSTGGGSAAGGRTPRITMEIDDTSYIITEGDSITVTATIVGHPDAAIIIVDLSFTGSAVEGTDYTVSDNQIVIMPGETSGSITISSTDERLIEIRESIIVDATTVTGATELNGFQQVTIFINDNDAPAPAPMMAGSSVNQNSLHSTTVTNAPLEVGTEKVVETNTDQQDEEESPSSFAASRVELPTIDNKSVDDMFVLISEDDIWV